MEESINYRKYALLYVDDEKKSLEYFKKAFKEEFRIFTASNAQEGYRVFEENKDEIGILIADQRMPGEKGVELLQRVRQSKPQVLRILVTAYTDLDAAINAVNSGSIYKYVTKPWNILELNLILKRGLEFFNVQQERDHLLKEKISVVNNIVIADRVISFGILAAGLSHYVRNSMAAVRTFIDLAPVRLKEEKVDFENLHNPNFWRDFYEHVQIQIKQIIEIFNDLSVESEDASTSFQDQVYLRDLFETVNMNLKSLFQEKDIIVKNNITDTLPSMNVDKDKFQRLFQLLIQSMLYNLPEGSEINIDAKELSTYNGHSPKVKIEIKDNGPGLPQDELRSMFYPFKKQSGEPQEFGINLLACYFIVYHHGGNIEVKSEKNGGTNFILTFRANTQLQSPREDESRFLTKVMVNEKLWERMLAEY